MFSFLPLGGNGNNWTPQSVSGMLAWYDASRGVIQSSNAVSQWSDQSGHGYHLIQSVLANKPTYQATGWNSTYPAISFDGIDDVLTNVSSGFADYPNGTNIPVSIFLTLNVSSTTNVRTIFTWANDPANTNFVGFFIDTAHHMRPDLNGVGPTGTTVADGGNKRLAYVAGSGTVSTYVDSILDINGASFSGTTGGENKVYVGLSSIGTSPFVGVISEIIIYSSKLTVSDFNQYRIYSAAKWGG